MNNYQSSGRFKTRNKIRRFSFQSCFDKNLARTNKLLKGGTYLATHHVQLFSSFVRLETCDTPSTVKDNYLVTNFDKNLHQAHHHVKDIAHFASHSLCCAGKQQANRQPSHAIFLLLRMSTRHTR
ncbi:hypothetical protein ACROYT_G040589 [Oculina patagonica]